MTPEAAAFLAKAQTFLEKARRMLGYGWPDEAGRAAYLAGFHAAQALIFERQGRVPKTHAGVQTEFSRHIKDEAGFGLDLRRFLSRAYNLKGIADYETGPAAQVSQSRAEAACATADIFVAAVAALIDPP